METTGVGPLYEKKVERQKKLAEACDAAFKKMEGLIPFGLKKIKEINEATTEYHARIGEYARLTGGFPVGHGIFGRKER